VVFIAQGFGIGRIPFAPGTWGTLLGFAWVALLFSSTSLWIYLAGTLFGVVAAAYVCGRAEKIMNQKDPGSVVLDEIIAIPICVIAAALMPLFPWPQDGAPETWLRFICDLSSWSGIVSHFLLFRLFDIWKPWPVRQSQTLPGGWGVVMDDVLAAVYVNLVALALYALAYFLH
jgi:phosphatidylglycerophosphatase A